jgi:hypothetical protein
MAELRSCEKELCQLQSVYEALRQAHDKLAQGLPPLQVLLLVVNDGDETTRTLTTTDAVNMSPTVVLEKLHEIQAKLGVEGDGGNGVNDDGSGSLQSHMCKFRKRALEKDPITQQPRYGEQTLQRVQRLLSAYTELQGNMAHVFSSHPGNSDDGHCPEQSEAESSGTLTTASVAAAATASSSADCSTTMPTPLIHEIQSQAREEQEQAAEEARRLAQQREEERLQHEMMQRALQEQERQEIEARRLQAEQQLAELERVAREERQAQIQAQELARQRDREWMNGIEKGPDGVRKQLDVLKTSTADDLSARRIAINALQQLFGQIVAHPEQVQYRRVRRNHERFQNDIGRHAGGTEILIAAGFVTAVVDEVPSFISKEPNVETDLDGWSVWFDLLKSTLQIIEQELLLVQNK